MSVEMLNNPFVFVVVLIVALIALKVVIEVLKNAALVAALITLGMIALGVAYFVK